jgi:hypothetical protein
LRLHFRHHAVTVGLHGDLARAELAGDLVLVRNSTVPDFIAFNRCRDIAEPV